MTASSVAEQLHGLPGAELIVQGIKDLAAGIESIPGLLVAVGAHRIRERLPGLALDGLPERPELRLYALLRLQHPREAYSQYNAYLRRLTRFCHALESHRTCMGEPIG
ncbi:MAG: hypothetical protein O2923_14635 [Verrucomicrobia bacterium]|nr:hypothetical protein [Verrucomicrobiota bacterium]MDA1088644.1 hypothetical protein [Verrucomicrobiota bacterium]